MTDSVFCGLIFIALRFVEVTLLYFSFYNIMANLSFTVADEDNKAWKIVVKSRFLYIVEQHKAPKPVESVNILTKRFSYDSCGRYYFQYIYLLKVMLINVFISR